MGGVGVYYKHTFEVLLSLDDFPSSMFCLDMINCIDKVIEVELVGQDEWWQLLSAVTRTQGPTQCDLQFSKFSNFRNFRF